MLQNAFLDYIYLLNQVFEPISITGRMDCEIPLWIAKNN